MYVQPSFLAMHEAEVHHDADAYPRPKQPGNDIDVYLRPLVDELLLVWKEEGVCVPKTVGRISTSKYCFS
jgi:hypothetical protein